MSAIELSWSKGLTNGTLSAAEIGAATLWSALDMPEGFGFEVCSRVKVNTPNCS